MDFLCMWDSVELGNDLCERRTSNQVSKVQYQREKSNVTEPNQNKTKFIHNVNDWFRFLPFIELSSVQSTVPRFLLKIDLDDWTYYFATRTRYSHGAPNNNVVCAHIFTGIGSKGNNYCFRELVTSDESKHSTRRIDDLFIFRQIFWITITAHVIHCFRFSGSIPLNDRKMKFLWPKTNISKPFQSQQVSYIADFVAFVSKNRPSSELEHFAK